MSCLRIPAPCRTAFTVGYVGAMQRLRCNFLTLYYTLERKPRPAAEPRDVKALMAMAPSLLEKAPSRLLQQR